MHCTEWLKQTQHLWRERTPTAREDVHVGSFPSLLGKGLTCQTCRFPGPFPDILTQLGPEMCWLARALGVMCLVSTDLRGPARFRCSCFGAPRWQWSSQRPLLSSVVVPCSPGDGFEAFREGGRSGSKAAKGLGLLPVKEEELVGPLWLWYSWEGLF